MGQKENVVLVITSVDPSADVQGFIKDHFSLAGLIHGAGDNRNSPLLVTMDLHMVKLRLTHWQINIGVLSKKGIKQKQNLCRSRIINK
jgi:hypothetical protein